MEETMTGRIVHFEIPFDDGNRARSFYSEVFGWQAQEMPELQYTMAMTGPVGENGMPTEPGYINGGMFQRNEQLKVPVLTIGVDSIDETLKAVEASGGTTIEGRQPVGDMGFTAYINDSEGNVIGLWENAS
jgi:predicted enzyme related to lactoylglutathione lyase